MIERFNLAMPFVSKNKMGSKIIIHGLKADCIIGDLPYERANKQGVLIDIEVHCDISMAVKTDRMEKAVDYDALASDVKSFAEKSSYFLIESLVSNIAGLILRDYPAAKVLVRVKKPSAIKFADYAAVEVVKERG